MHSIIAYINGCAGGGSGTGFREFKFRGTDVWGQQYLDILSHEINFNRGVYQAPRQLGNRRQRETCVRGVYCNFQIYRKKSRVILSP